MTAAIPLFLYQLDQPLSTSTLNAYANDLSSLQGNILKSHGRDVALHLFLTFRDDPVKAKSFLSKLALKLTSAAEQRAQTLRDKHGQELFTAIYLSAKGYQYLGYKQGNFSDEFWNGMRAAQLGDPPVGQWDARFQKDIHAMILFAHDQPQELQGQLDSLRSQVGGLAEIGCELGTTNRNPAGQVTEHFGYVDGISQPLFYQSDLNGVPAANWDPAAGPNLVLARDPYGASGEHCGSYLVFRKLEQDVKGFQTQLQQLANTLQLAGADAQRAGAMVIGRFPDGTPAVLLPVQPQQAGGPANDFSYLARDPAGNQCPFAAHIRKINPRGEFGPTLGREKAHRIARRGITYGQPNALGENLDSLPETGVGLLFQCCQADLKEQFEFLQGRWANQDNAPKSGGGKDPVIGESSEVPLHDLEFPNPWGTAQRTPFSFQSCVKMKGGEYFFAPSIDFLVNLA
jgi:Dyp-type peroxidase family